MSQQEVKLEVCLPGYGTFAPDVPPLTPIFHRDGVGMVYHQGTLYADAYPEQWTAVDHDRAAALGYGKREAWPEFPQVISYAYPKPGSGRFDKYYELEAALFPQHRIWFSLTAFQANRSRGGRTMALPLEEFDRMTTQEIVKWVRARLP